MDLIDRYLSAIRRNLPPAKADDITAELREDLLSRVEEREDRLGRSLGKGEIAELIREFGHPLIVASRYRPHQYLVGPDVFPFYVAALRIVLIVVALALVVGAGANIVFDHANAVKAVLHMVGGIWTGLFTSIGIVTVIFFVLERTGFPADHLRKWRPEELPKVTEKRKSQWESAFEVAVGIAAILWWIGLIHIPVFSNLPGFRLDPAPIWTTLYWPILGLMVAGLINNLIAWLRPSWKAARVILSVGTAACALGVLWLIYQAGHWVTVVAPTLPPAKLIELQNGVDLAIRWSIVVTGAIWVLQGAQELWRISGRRINLPY